MSKKSLEEKTFCIDCGAVIAKYGDKDRQRYVCSICGADYRNIEKTTLSRLTKKLNIWEDGVAEIDKEIEELTEKRELLKNKIDMVNESIFDFKHMLEMLNGPEVSNYDKELAAETRMKIKVTLKLK